jgi:hypothetical protein
MWFTFARKLLQRIITCNGVPKVIYFHYHLVDPTDNFTRSIRAQNTTSIERDNEEGYKLRKEWGSEESDPECELFTLLPERAGREALAGLREMVWTWIALRGPVAGWGHKLRVEMSRAKGRGQLTEWRKNCFLEIEKGSDLRQRLLGVAFEPLETSRSAQQDFWRQCIDLLQVIQAGLATLEAWMDVSNSD